MCDLIALSYLLPIVFFFHNPVYLDYIVFIYVDLTLKVKKAIHDPCTLIKENDNDNKRDVFNIMWVLYSIPAMV